MLDNIVDTPADIDNSIGDQSDIYIYDTPVNQQTTLSQTSSHIKERIHLHEDRSYHQCESDQCSIKSSTYELFQSPSSINQTSSSISKRKQDNQYASSSSKRHKKNSVSKESEK